METVKGILGEAARDFEQYQSQVDFKALIQKHELKDILSKLEKFARAAH